MMLSSSASMTTSNSSSLELSGMQVSLEIFPHLQCHSQISDQKTHHYPPPHFQTEEHASGWYLARSTMHTRHLCTAPSPQVARPASISSDLFFFSTEKPYP